MTVDYALQMKEIQRAVLAQAEVTKSFWNDEVARRYFEKYVDCNLCLANCANTAQSVYNYVRNNSIGVVLNNVAILSSKFL